ncbi:hypothetical protein TrVFT333_002019 [Trichoderma virens FT-333]|nr:hypothetical protein TrVFT333_002019 [Trichoderma virens FT-333]
MSRSKIHPGTRVVSAGWSIYDLRSGPFISVNAEHRPRTRSVTDQAARLGMSSSIGSCGPCGSSTELQVSLGSQKLGRDPTDISQ